MRLGSQWASKGEAQSVAQGGAVLSWPGGLSYKVRMPPPGDTTGRDSIELEVEMATWPLGLLMLLKQQAKKSVTVLAGC